MAGKHANVTVHHEAHEDPRFQSLAELAGWSVWEAFGRMVKLWARCTSMRTDRPGNDEICTYLGMRGPELIVAARLGEKLPDGIRVKGGGLTGGDTDRFGWYEPVESQNRAAGKARAAKAARDARGRMVAGRNKSSAPSSGDQRAGEILSSGTSETPAFTSDRPASGFRIPEEELPPARAIPPSIGPVGTPWQRRQRYWVAMLEADARLRQAGIERNAPPLPPAPAGANELNMNSCERQFLDAGFTAEQTDQRMLHIVAVAEAEAMRERSRRYFKPAVIWKPENANRAGDTSLEEARAGPSNNSDRKAEPPPIRAGPRPLD